MTKHQHCELAMMSKSLCYQKDSITMIYSQKQTRSFISQEIDREQDQFVGELACWLLVRVLLTYLFCIACESSIKDEVFGGDYRYFISQDIDREQY